MFMYAEDVSLKLLTFIAFLRIGECADFLAELSLFRSKTANYAGMATRPAPIELAYFPILICYGLFIAPLLSCEALS